MDVLKYIQDNFPAPCYVNTSEYEIGTILFTANPYIRTNATIISVIEENNLFQVLTDIGNIINQDKKDLIEYYLPPVCKRTKEWPDNIDDHFTMTCSIQNFKYSGV